MFDGEGMSLYFKLKGAACCHPLVGSALPRREIGGRYSIQPGDHARRGNILSALAFEEHDFLQYGGAYRITSAVDLSIAWERSSAYWRLV